MSILSFGGGDKRRVSENEMEEIRRKVSAKFDKHEERDFDDAFHASLHDDDRLREGITRKEYELGMERLRDNSTLEEDDLNLLERHFEDHLRD